MRRRGDRAVVPVPPGPDDERGRGRRTGTSHGPRSRTGRTTWRPLWTPLGWTGSRRGHRTGRTSSAYRYADATPNVLPSWCRSGHRPRPRKSDSRTPDELAPPKPISRSSAWGWGVWIRPTRQPSSPASCPNPPRSSGAVSMSFSSVSTSPDNAWRFRRRARRHPTSEPRVQAHRARRASCAPVWNPATLQQPKAAGCADPGERPERSDSSNHLLLSAIPRKYLPGRISTGLPNPPRAQAAAVTSSS